MNRVELYTPSQVARILDFDTETIRRYIRDGKIRAYKTHTGRYKISEESVKQYLEECKKNAEQLFLFN